MQGLREYLLSVVAVCMICAVASVMLKNQMLAKVLRLVSGILVLLVVITPLLKIDLQDISENMRRSLSADSQSFDVIRSNAEIQLAEQVKTATEKHIEEIASRYGMSLQARVKVDDSQLPTPIEVELIGVPDPDTVGAFTDYIVQNIGILKENQHWRGYEGSS